MKLTCIVCPLGCNITVEKKEERWAVKGNRCAKGEKYAVDEVTQPMRSLCTTIKTNSPDMPRLPVRTDGEIPLNLIMNAMDVINRTEITRPVVNCGDVIIENILETGINIIATCPM